MTTGYRATFAIAALLSAVALPAAAADVGDFYKGKQMRMIIGYSTGGGYDLYARLLSKYLPKHLPGAPTIVPQNMDGAGSRVAANYLYEVAPKDGTVIGIVGQNTPADQALNESGVKFDAAKFNWIGNPIVDNNLTYSMKDYGYETLDDVKKKGGLVCGATGAASPSVTQPLMLNNLLGTKIKIIVGYPGGNDVNLAVERGEVNCRGSNSWASTVATLGRFMENKRLQVLVQFGVTADPAISEYQGRKVPTILDLTTKDDDRQAILLNVAGVSMGRPFLAPPDVPADRVAALRKAFDDTMKDKEFIEETKKSKLDLNPLSGLELQKIAAETVKASPAVVKRLQDLIKQDNIEELKK
jgi:tripartite-type tricarboxylate transporter receptor subunit TctC